jgi:hypothetical protein
MREDKLVEEDSHPAVVVPDALDPGVGVSVNQAHERSRSWSIVLSVVGRRRTLNSVGP